MTIRRSTIANNHATQDGGGIENNGLSTIEDSIITNNTVTNNTADGIGGGIS